MAGRAQDLAERFAQANKQFSAYIETIPTEQWNTPVSAEDLRSVGIVVRHVAWGYTYEQLYFRGIAEGNPLAPVAEFDSLNGELARQWQSVPRDEVLVALRTAGEVVTDWVRGLSEEQLNQSGKYWVDGPLWTVDQWIEKALIGHVEHHLKEIRATIEA